MKITQGHPSLDLTTSRQLTSYWQEHSDLPAAELEAAVSASIDALYRARDAGGNIHAAGAACAVAALEAAKGCH